MARLLDSPLKIRRILVPVESMNPVGFRPVRFAASLIANHQTEITLLHVCSPGAAKKRKEMLYSQLNKVAKRFLSEATVDIRIIGSNNFVREIIKASATQELIILRSQRQRVGVDSLALGATTKPLIQNINCSIVFLGEL